MVTFDNPEFTVKAGRFTATVRTSYSEGTFTADFDPTAFASVQGDAQNFVCTAGHVEVVFENPQARRPADKGRVIGFEVTEKWGGKAHSFSPDLRLAVAGFGSSVAEQLA